MQHIVQHIFKNRLFDAFSVDSVYVAVGRKDAEVSVLVAEQDAALLHITEPIYKRLFVGDVFRKIPKSPQTRGLLGMIVVRLTAPYRARYIPVRPVGYRARRS